MKMGYEKFLQNSNKCSVRMEVYQSEKDSMELYQWIFSLSLIHSASFHRRQSGLGSFKNAYIESCNKKKCGIEIRRENLRYWNM